MAREHDVTVNNGADVGADANSLILALGDGEGEEDSANVATDAAGDTSRAVCVWVCDGGCGSGFGGPCSDFRVHVLIRMRRSR